MYTIYQYLHCLVKILAHKISPRSQQKCLIFHETSNKHQDVSKIGVSIYRQQIPMCIFLRKGLLKPHLEI